MLLGIIRKQYLIKCREFFAGRGLEKQSRSSGFTYFTKILVVIIQIKAELMARYPGLQIKLSSLILYKKEQIESIMFVSPAANTKDLGTAQTWMHTHICGYVSAKERKAWQKAKLSQREKKSKWNKSIGCQGKLDSLLKNNNVQEKYF